jgi:hypothetical protein
VTLYRPGYGPVLQFQAVASKLKVAKLNMTTMLEHPTKFFKLDPNGHVVVLDEDPTPQQEKAKADAAQLRASTGGLFEKLMASPAARCAAALGVRQPAPVAVTRACNIGFNASDDGGEVAAARSCD